MPAIVPFFFFCASSPPFLFFPLQYRVTKTKRRDPRAPGNLGPGAVCQQHHAGGPLRQAAQHAAWAQQHTPNHHNPALDCCTWSQTCEKAGGACTGGSVAGLSPAAAPGAQGGLVPRPGLISPPPPPPPLCCRTPPPPPPRKKKKKKKRSRCGRGRGRARAARARHGQRAAGHGAPRAAAPGPCQPPPPPPRTCRRRHQRPHSNCWGSQPGPR